MIIHFYFILILLIILYFKSIFNLWFILSSFFTLSSNIYYFYNPCFQFTTLFEEQSIFIPILSQWIKKLKTYFKNFISNLSFINLLISQKLIFLTLLKTLICIRIISFLIKFFKLFIDVIFTFIKFLRLNRRYLFSYHKTSA